MTNNWVDLDNSTAFIVMGANPVENHPASIAHLNTARYDTLGRGRNAALIVIDPRQTRTARMISAPQIIAAAKAKHDEYLADPVNKPVNNDMRMHDRYVRIRPGTNIAFINGVLNSIITWMYANKGTGGLNGTTADRFFAWHNSAAGISATNYTDDTTKTRWFIDDDGARVDLVTTEYAGAQYSFDGGTTWEAAPIATGWPKYCDSRILVNDADSTTGTQKQTKFDYKRAILKTGSGKLFSNMPAFAADVDTAGCVFQRLKTHVAKYPAATVAQICGCTEADIAAVRDAWIANSRFASSDFGAASATMYAAGYRAACMMYAMGATQYSSGSQGVRSYAVIQTLMGNMGRAGGGINALRGIHNVQGSTDMGVLFDLIPAYSGNPGVDQSYADYSNKLFGNRVVGKGAKDAYKEGDIAWQQRGFYNMTREWFGSRDVGAAAVATPVVNEAVPFNGVVTNEAITFAAGAATKALSKKPVISGTVVVTNVAGDVTYASPADYTVDLVNGTITRVATGAIGATDTVHVDFMYGETKFLAGNPVVHGSVTVTNAAGDVTYVAGTDYSVDLANGTITRLNTAFVPGEAVHVDYTYKSDPAFDKLYACWPKGNGVQHIEAFRRMCPASGAAYNYTPTATAPRIQAAVVWGQNPAITEPNQGAVRTGLENLDLLVVTDMFANETAQCKRKATGVTYLLPACSHVEEAGAATSSGRWIQWRDRARLPKGNSKSDVELLLRFAKALNDANMFSHIESQWTGTALAGLDAFDVLYAKYGWNGTDVFEAYDANNVITGVSGKDFEGNTLTGNEYVIEQLFKEQCSPLDGYTAAGAPVGFVGGHKGTMWIYSGNKAAGHGAAYNPDEKTNVQPAIFEDGATSGTAVNWDIANRAKSRKGDVKYRGAASQYNRYGWAWLLNRRVMYNNAELPGDVGDVFVAPGYLARLWTIAGSNTLADWSWLYRAYNQLADRPDRNTAAGQVHEFTGRFPGFTEPYETPHDGTGSKANLLSTWGKNTGAGAALIPSDTPVGTAANYPFVLTTIRCVEHFQGGPITRNNAANVDLEPEPWVEINSVDAAAKGIADGDYVNITTARSNSTTDQVNRSANGDIAPVAGWAKGFKARVGTGTLANQRVAPGTVAIPWHWGERGLGIGSRANDLTIDAYDANTRIPEYKACLCNITKVTP